MSVELVKNLVFDDHEIEESQDVQALLDSRLTEWKAELEAEGIRGEVYIHMHRSLTQYGKVLVHAEVRPEQKLADVIPITRGIK